MNVHSRQWRRVVALATALVLAGGTGACAVNDRGSVSILAIWTGDEQRAFGTILDRFTARTGIKVNYTGTRAVSQVLATDVQTGAPPDVAVLSSAGELSGYARRHALHPLDQAGMHVAAPQGSLWQHVEALGGPVRYAVAVKATLKSMIWYRKDHRFDVPQRWDDLVRTGATAPGAVPSWCLGLEATPASGWPGTDWVEDILLHTNAEAYQQLSAGRLSWSDQRVQAAWRAWDQVLQTVAPPGARDGMLKASFDDADRSLVTGLPTTCWLDHEASFVAGTATASAPAAHHDVDFFPFPDAAAPGAPDGHRSWEVSVDLAGMFRDTPQARQLITYLASDEAQRMWPAVSGTAFSTRPNVQYGTDVGRRIAGILTGGATLCVDPSDLMPPALTDAFYGAVLAYAHRPDRLATLLQQLDEVRATVQGQIADVPCGTG